MQCNDIAACLLKLGLTKGMYMCTCAGSNQVIGGPSYVISYIHKPCVAVLQLIGR